jgi:3-oxoacyl-[acyl-carrier protein] reductase
LNDREDPKVTEPTTARFGLDKLPYAQRDARLTDLLDLTGVRVAVTGGGGPNLGQAIVHRFAGSGASVAVVDRDMALAAGVAEQAAQRWKTRTEPFAADLTKADDCRRVVADIVAAFGGIDVWVNNVGGGAGRFSAMTTADIDRIVGTTLMSTLYATSAVLPTLLDRGSGLIINISSEGAVMSDPNIGLYAACKSAIDGFTRNLAADVGPRGVRVVAVRPGMMLGETLVSSLNHPEQHPDRVASMSRAIERVTVGRACLPEEVANMVVFLATPAGAHVHGTAVSVGGGMSA